VPVLIAPSLAEHFRAEGLKKGYLLDSYIALLLLERVPANKARRMHDVVIFSHAVPSKPAKRARPQR
jgi:hypothetical protein